MKTILFFLFCLFVGGVSSAKTLKVNIDKELGASVKPLNTPLSRLKEYEKNLKWTECANMAPQVFASHKDLHGWIALTWLHCLEESQKKVKNQSALDKVFTSLDRHPELLQTGPWSSSLAEALVKVKMQQIDEMVRRRQHKLAADAIDKLLQTPVKMTTEQKSKAFQILGDLALLEADSAKAQFLFEQAQSYKDSKYLQEKISNITKPKARVSESEQQVITSKVVEISTAQGQLEQRILAAQKAKDFVAMVKEMVLLLNDYPGSRLAGDMKTKPLDIYYSADDKLMKARLIVEMERADGARLLEWAQSLHRRAEFVSSLALAQEFLKKNPTSPDSTSALWIAGRSAHFLGLYDRALQSYRQLFSNHQGSEEASEAMFRSGLIYFRKKEYSNAIALLEKVVQEGRDRYALNARYWLVRALQEIKSERAKDAVNELIEAYPFTYYGLRLRAESNQGVLSWPVPQGKAPDLSKEFYLVGKQKGAWLRFKELSRAGWVAEAYQELGGLPFLKDPNLKIALAEKMLLNQQYLTAIRWVNEALDAEPRFGQERFVKLGFPQAFSSLYAAEAERFGVDTVLLKSLTRQESGFNSHAVSRSNALGLMQMIPPTAQEVARKIGLKIQLPDDMFRPEVNIPMGTFYISQMLAQFSGHVPVALAAYNAGPTRLKVWLEARPELQKSIELRDSAPINEIWFDELPWSETSFYVKAILRNILLYRLAEKGTYSIIPALWQDLVEKRAL